MPKPKVDTVSRPTFQLVLRAEPRPGDDNDPGAFRRLRAVLKLIGRGYGLTCLAVEAVTSETKEGAVDG